MSDFLKASDLGIAYHVTASDAFHKSYNQSHFYTHNLDDILKKITSLSCELDEREFQLALVKPLLPVGFKIKPDTTPEQTRHTPPIQQSHAPLNHAQKKPPLLPLDSVQNNLPTDISAIGNIIEKANKLAQEATDLNSLLSSIKDFDTGLDSQRFAAQTLAYNDSDKIDILWITDCVSHDDDKNHKIMSDSAGNMVINLFDGLGYARNNTRSTGKIGCGAMSFWAVNAQNTEHQYQICLPFVKRLIYFLNPKKIILSGDMALKYLAQKDDVLVHHGQKCVVSVDDKNFDAYACFSLSYIFKSEIIKKLFWFDLLKILYDNR